MKAKSRKFSEAQAARLAAAITSREADAATHRADLARVMFKKARKAFKQARKAAKRAAKRAKEAQKKFAPLAKHLKPSKPKPPRKSPTKQPKLKTKTTAGRRTRVPPKPAAKVISLEVAPKPPADSSPPNSPAD